MAGLNARKSSSKRNPPMTEINVTPMVDVMLVLLVIFMVAAPMMQSGVDVNLQSSDAPSVSQSQEPPLALTITADGSLYLQDVAVSEEELLIRLEAIMSERQSDRIYIRADQSNNYGEVFRIMGDLSGAGYSNIGLVGELSGAQ